jgi:hypothetical protein
MGRGWLFIVPPATCPWYPYRAKVMSEGANQVAEETDLTHHLGDAHVYRW